MTTLIHKLKQFFLILLPIIYISYILYIRLFLVRDPRSLYVPLSWLQIVSISLIIAGVGCRIYFLLQKLNIIKPKPSEPTTNKILINLKIYFNKVGDGFSQLWTNFIRQFTAESWTVTFFLVGLIKKIQKSPNFLLFFILIFEVFPKLSILITFLVDIFYFKKFDYFYKSLFLLLLPLIFTAMESILNQYYADNIEELPQLITFDGTNFHFSENFKRPEPPIYDPIKDANDYVYNLYFPIRSIPLLMKYLNALRSYYKVYWLYLVILILHLIGWLTILYFGLPFTI